MISTGTTLCLSHLIATIYYSVMASAEFYIMSGGQKEEGKKADDQLEDEFACPGAARGLLQSVQPMVERVFAVSFLIGATEKQLSTIISQNEHIWVKMRGGRTDVEAAKVYTHTQFFIIFIQPFITDH